MASGGVFVRILPTIPTVPAPVFSACAVSSLGQVYGASNPGFIWSINKLTGVPTQLTFNAHAIVALTIDNANGILYYAIYGGGIWKYTISTGLETQVSSVTSNWTSLTFNSTDGNLYGCAAGSSYITNPATGAQSAWNVTAGLQQVAYYQPSNSFYAIGSAGYAGDLLDITNTWPVLLPLTDPHWSTGANWVSMGSGQYEHVAGATAALTNNLVAVGGLNIGQTYEIGYECIFNSGGTWGFSVGGVSLSGLSNVSSSLTFVATTSAGIVVTPSSGFNGTVQFNILEQSSTTAIAGSWAASAGLTVDPVDGYVYGFPASGDIQRYNIATTAVTTVTSTPEAFTGIGFDVTTLSIFAVNASGQVFQVQPTLGTVTLLSLPAVAAIGYSTADSVLTEDIMMDGSPSVTYAPGYILSDITAENSVDLSQGKGGFASAIEAKFTIGDPTGNLAYQFSNNIQNWYGAQVNIADIDSLGNVTQLVQVYIAEIDYTDGDINISCKSQVWFNTQCLVRNTAVTVLTVDPIDPLNPSVPINALQTTTLPLQTYPNPVVVTATTQAAGVVVGSRNVSIECKQTISPQKIAFYGFPGMPGSPTQGTELFYQGDLSSYNSLLNPATIIQTIASKYHAPNTRDGYTGESSTPNIPAAWVDFEMFLGTWNTGVTTLTIDTTTQTAFENAVNTFVANGYKIVLSDGNWSLDMQCVSSWQSVANTGSNGFGWQGWGHYASPTTFRQNGRLNLLYQEQEYGLPASFWTPFRLLRCVLSDDYQINSQFPLGDGSASQINFIPPGGLTPGNVCLYAVPATLPLTSGQTSFRGFAKVVNGDIPQISLIQSNLSMVNGIDELATLDSTPDNYTSFQSVPTPWAYANKSYPGTTAIACGFLVNPTSPAALVGGSEVFSGNTNQVGTTPITGALATTSTSAGAAQWGGVGLPLSPISTDESYSNYVIYADALATASFLCTATVTGTVTFTMFYAPPGTDPTASINTYLQSVTTFPGGMTAGQTYQLNPITASSVPAGNIEWGLVRENIAALQGLGSPRMWVMGGTLSSGPGTWKYYKGTMSMKLTINNMVLYGIEKISNSAPQAAIYPYPFQDKISQSIPGASIGIGSPIQYDTSVMCVNGQGVWIGTNSLQSPELTWLPATTAPPIASYLPQLALAVPQGSPTYNYACLLDGAANLLNIAKWSTGANATALTWNQVNLAASAFGTDFTGHGSYSVFQGLATATHTDGGLVFAFADGTIILAYVTGSGTGIAYTVYAPGTTGLIGVVSCVTTDGTNLYFGSNGFNQVVKFTGSAWSSQTLPTPSYGAAPTSVQALSYIASATTLVAMANAAFVAEAFTSTNGGTTWSATAAAPNAAGTTFAAAGIASNGTTLVASNSTYDNSTNQFDNAILNTILYSANSGATWTAVQLPGGSADNNSNGIVCCPGLPIPIWLIFNNGIPTVIGSNTYNLYPSHCQTQNLTDLIHWITFGSYSPPQAIKSLANTYYRNKDWNALTVNTPYNNAYFFAEPTSGGIFGEAFSANSPKLVTQAITEVANDWWLLCGENSQPGYNATADVIEYDVPKVWFGAPEQITTLITVQYAPWAGGYLGSAYIQNTDKPFNPTYPTSYYYSGWDNPLYGTNFGLTIWNACRAAYLKTQSAVSVSYNFDSIFDANSLGDYFTRHGSGLGYPAALGFRYNYMCKQPRFIELVVDGNKSVTAQAFSCALYAPNKQQLAVRGINFPSCGIVTRATHNYTQGKHAVQVMFAPE